MEYYSDENIDFVNVESSSSVLYGAGVNTRDVDNSLEDHLEYPYNLNCYSKQDHDGFSVQANTTRSNVEKDDLDEEKDCLQHEITGEPSCLDSLLKLKDSTKKLLLLVEEIQEKMVSKHNYRSNQFQVREFIKSIPESKAEVSSLTDFLSAKAFKKLETKAKTIDTIVIEVEDDCSVYKRLTRKCHCLNQYEYNDFIIHFNESTKYFTNVLGEIIKNIRILKKFLYMGGNYTKHALIFLDSGLSFSSPNEKDDIVQGCTHADICNIFDEKSIVDSCILWPCSENNKDNTTPFLAASFLYKLAQMEEGRKYLNYSSKITNDLRKVLKKKATKLEFSILESLQATLNLMHPDITKHTDVTYYSKIDDEGYGTKAFTALLQYRNYMTLEEVFVHLRLLNKLSDNDNGKKEIITFLPPLMNLFKEMLIEYDNSKMNIIITNILNNVVSRSMVKRPLSFKAAPMIDVGTGVMKLIEMKNEINQFPLPKNTKKGTKSRAGTSHNFRSSSRLRKPYSPVIIVPVDNE